jgi:hypothetical protein
MALALLGGLVIRRFRPAIAPLVQRATLLGLGLLPPLAMLPDSVRALRIFRETGGRYNDKGTLIRTHRDLLTVLRDVVRPKLPHGSAVQTHASAAWGWEHFWAAQAPSRGASAVPAAAADPPDPLWLGRASGLPAEFQQKVASEAQVRVYGDVWVVDRRNPPAELQAYAIEEQEPGALAWFAYGALEPRYQIGQRPDPFLTWEWRLHLDQAATRPAREPGSPGELRILHNAAIDAGDAARAARLRARLQPLLDRRVHVAFTRDVRLIGVRTIASVQPRLELWFEAGGPLSGDLGFEVRSRVVRAAPFSLIPADPVERRMAWPPSIAPALWRKGFLYTQQVVLNHRIGVEQYTGFWVGRDRGSVPLRLDGKPSTLLLELH